MPLRCGRSMTRAVRCAVLAAILLKGCSAKGPTTPSTRFQVSFTSQAPDRCPGPCLRLAWIDSNSVAQGLLKLAVQVQNIPTRGISNVTDILSGRTAGTFSESSRALAFRSFSAGDFFERLGKPVRYEASDLGGTLDNCCLTTYAVGFPTPAATDRVSGDGTVLVLIYNIRQRGTVDVDPGIGLFDGLIATTYDVQIEIR